MFGTAAMWSRRDWWRFGRRAAARGAVVGAAVALALLGGVCSAAFAQTTITVTSTGAHTLKVVISYKETTRNHRHPKNVTVTKTLTQTFKVC